MLFKFSAPSFFLLILFTDVVTPFKRVGNRKSCKSYKPKMPDYNNNLRVTQRKCVEYMWKLDERNKLKNCRDFLVINGQRTYPTEYPHMGAVGWISSNNSLIFLCGSTLISENFVLTSAHCTKVHRGIDLKNPRPKIVRLGVTNIYKSNPRTRVDVNIKKIIRHPNYSPPKKYYDIALLKLATKVTFTKNVHPACLWTESNLNIQNEVTVTGWGSTDKHHTYSPDLLYAKVDIFNSKCNINKLNHRNWWGLSEHQLCAGKLDGSVDTCNGDSGGPIQYKIFNTTNEGTMHMVIGITTFGPIKCAQKNMPTVYTKVSSFISWIEENVWPNESKLSRAQIVFQQK